MVICIENGFVQELRLVYIDTYLEQEKQLFFFKLTLEITLAKLQKSTYILK